MGAADAAQWSIVLTDLLENSGLVACSYDLSQSSVITITRGQLLLLASGSDSLTLQDIYI